MEKYERFLKFKVSKYDELNEFIPVEEYVSDIYHTGNENLDRMFSYYHSHINRLLGYMDIRIASRYYTADESRELIRWKNEIVECQKYLANSKYSFSMLPMYKKILFTDLDFLEPYGGTSIPDNFQNIDIQQFLPIFIKSVSVQIDREQNTFADAKLIGLGSYANVYKYKDPFYDKHFAIKRAKKDLDEKELERFKREFEFMKVQKSPYILEVYRYFADNSYTMEMADHTIDEFITKNNTKISNKERIGLVTQILKAFKYIESQCVFHRDISTTNVLIKEYNDVKVIKLSDFGLVKKPDSTLTSKNTEFKGSLNDPRLEIEGFSNYSIIHETYALTRLIYFVLTGRKRLDEYRNVDINEFVNKGLSENHEDRYQSITHLSNCFIELSKKIV